MCSKRARGLNVDLSVHPLPCFLCQGRRRRSGRTASAGPLFLAEYAFRRVPFSRFYSGFIQSALLSITHVARVINRPN